MNLDVWNDLSDEERAAIEDSLDDLNLAFAKAEVNEAVSVFEEVQKDDVYPMQVYELTDDERELWVEPLKASYENNVAKAAEVNPAATEIGEAYEAHREAADTALDADGYPW